MAKNAEKKVKKSRKIEKIIKKMRFYMFDKQNIVIFFQSKAEKLEKKS